MITFWPSAIDVRHTRLQGKEAGVTVTRIVKCHQSRSPTFSSVALMIAPGHAMRGFFAGRPLLSITSSAQAGESMRDACWSATLDQWRDWLGKPDELGVAEMQPQEKVVELSTARRKLVDDYAKTFYINKFACRHLENELKALVKLPAFEGVARLEFALLHAFQRDYKEAMRNVERSRILMGREDMAVAFAEALAALYCGKIKDAASIISSLELIADPAWLDNVSRVAVHAGMFQKAELCIQKLKLLKPDAKTVLLDMRGEVPDTDILAGAAVMRRYGLTDADVVDRVQVAADVVMAQLPELPFVIYSYNATYDDGILYSFPVRMAESEIVELEWKISEALVDGFDDPLSEVVAFSVVPSELIAREH